MFLRLYQLSEMALFDFDQEYAAQFANDVLKVFPIRLIGQGLSVPGLFMGPLFFYYLAPFFLLSNLHPVGGYIGVIVLRLITVLAYFFIFRQIFNTKTGLIAAFLNSIIFVAIQMDWTMASYNCEFAVLLTWWCLYHYWHGNYKYLILLGFLFGLYTSFHPVLFPFYFVFLAILLIKHRLPRLKIILTSLVALVVPLVPLIIFEYFHKFLEVKVLFSMQESAGREIKTLNTILDYVRILFNYPLTILGQPQPPFLNIFIPVACLTLLIILVWKRIDFWKDKFHISILVITASVSLIYYALLPKHVPPYYFTGITTLLFIYLTASISLLIKSPKKRKVLFFILTYIVLMNVCILYNLWQRKTYYSLSNKEKIIQEIAKRIPNDRKAEIHYNIEYGWHYGFGYLMRYYNIAPNSTPNRQKYEIVLPLNRTQEHVDYIFGDIGLRITD